MKRVVITGLSMVTAVGNDKDTTFKAIIDGQCGIDNITLFDPSRLGVKLAAEVKNFDPETVMDPKEVKKADRFIHLGLKAAKDAMIDSNIGSFGDEEAFKFGTSAASGIGGLPNIEKNSIILEQKGPRRISPFFIPSSLANMLGGFVSIEHKLKGPNLACVTACAAGTHGITEAFKTIVLGGADRMLVVAAESAICEVGMGGFASMKALSTNMDPKTASRPFDRDRDGFVMGEGAASLILEDLEVALKRGAKIYGEIVGIGESGDANHITTPAPEGEGGYRAMRAALDMALSKYPDLKIDYVNAHGTSTPYNDWYETVALKRLFGGKENTPPVSSTKGSIGHCLGAAGAIEAVISIMAMQEGVLPPTIGFQNVDTEKELDLDYVVNLPRKAEINAIMSNSFGFGGTNGVVIIKKYV